jgi:hypothetical protein
VIQRGSGFEKLKDLGYNVKTMVEVEVDPTRVTSVTEKNYR